jgi:hypothetical protein
MNNNKVFDVNGIEIEKYDLVCDIYGTTMMVGEIDYANKIIHTDTSSLYPWYPNTTYKSNDLRVVEKHRKIIGEQK